MRNIHRVVPGVALDEALPVRGVEIEVSLPAAVSHSRPCESAGRVEDIAVVQCPLAVERGNAVVAGAAGHIVNHPVVVGIFHCHRSS